MPRASRSALDHGRRFVGLRRSGVLQRRVPGHAQRHTRAAELVDAVLAGARERPLQRAYEREMRAGLREFTWFIVRFTTPALAWLFANPRNVLRVEEAMVSMLSGHVFGARRTLRRLRVFKLLYYVTSAVHVARYAAVTAANCARSTAA